jgi:EAL domain-containing protein (putative c-di-GMP-specific phosphodiesterase class I)
LARTGGDEFVIVLEEPSVPKEAMALAERLLAMIARPMVFDDRAVYVTASIGISIFPQHGVNAPLLLKNGEVAMYRAKKRGGDSYQLYEREMEAQVSRRLRLETGLRQALSAGELQLHYQPQVDVAQRRVVGVEALVRWEHPELGMVPPDQFIPLAEETGLILSLDRWVTRTACSQYGEWLAAGIELKRMAINLSGRSFQDPDMVEDLTRIAWREAIPPSHVELEITETFLMEDPELSIEALQALKEHGFLLSIDDFGTAYSSLSYLKRFPVDQLKIDRAFIRDIPDDEDDKAITTAIIAMARQLGLRVLAEGVETVAQAEFLLAHGCQECQGYLFGRPMPVEELAPLLQNPAMLFPNGESKKQG